MKLKTLRKLLVLFIVVAMLVSLSGCFGVYKKIFDGITGNNENNESSNDQTENNANNQEENNETSANPVTGFPTAGGIEKRIRGLYFEVPEGTEENPYNGLLGVYEFYTTDYGQPGVDVSLVISSLDDGLTVKYYVENESRPAHSEGVTPFEKEVINGTIWYTCNNGRIFYFASGMDGDTIYEIEVQSVAGDPYNIRDRAIEMLRKTLKFY